MKIAVVSGAGGTLGDDMVFCVIKDWLKELRVVEEVILNPPSIEDCSAVIMGGCGIIYDEGVVMEGHQNPMRYYDYIVAAHRNNIPAIGFGLGWQGLPLASGEEMWVRTLNMLDFITVWNKRTKDYLESIGVTAPITATADLGFCLKPDTPYSYFENYDYALLTHPPKLMARDCHKPEWESVLFDRLNIISHKLVRKNYSLSIMSFCQFFTDTLKGIALSTNSNFIVKGDPHMLLGCIQEADVCITTTLHALISAATVGRKILALYPPEPLKPKIRWMAEELGVRRVPFDMALSDDIVEEAIKAQKDSPPNITKQLALNKINKQMLNEWIWERIFA